MGVKPAVACLVLAATTAGAGSVWACEAARERSLVIAVDEMHEGLMLPGGSKLIYRDGFVKGCRAKDRFCLSQIVLSKDAQLCGLKAPKQATVYLNYARRAFEHYQPVRSHEEGPGVFLTVVDLPPQRIAGLDVEHFVEVRCDKPAGFDNSSPLRIATLNKSSEVYGIKIPAGSTLVWRSPEEGGQVATIWLKNPQSLGTLSLPARAELDFDLAGKLMQIRSYEDSVAQVGSYPCQTGFSDGPTFYPNGRPSACMLARKVTIAGQTLRAGLVVHFLEDGSLASSGQEH